MNEITKEKVSLAVTKAIEEEHLMNTEAGKHLGIMPLYLSMIKKSDQWNKVPEKTWEIMRTWMYSGKTIKEYRSITDTTTEESAETTAIPAPTEPIEAKEPGVIEKRRELLAQKEEEKYAARQEKKTKKGQDVTSSPLDVQQSIEAKEREQEELMHLINTSIERFMASYKPEPTLIKTSDHKISIEITETEIKITVKKAS